MIKQIISGGQSGVDLLVIDWALKNNIKHQINVEKYYNSYNNGIVSKEVPIQIVSNKRGYSGGWVEVRRYNILHSDFTLIFVKKDIYKVKNSLGTMNACKEQNKPFSYVKLNSVDSIDVGIVIEALREHKVKVLNITGERKLTYIERKKIFDFLDMVILGREITNFEGII